MEPELKKILEKQHYRVIGEHSGVKLCHWLKEKLVRGRPCYKEVFYGIRSHRCLQMSPAINQCTQNCLFCWRFQAFEESTLKKIDDPEFILEKSIEAQRELISGFKGDPRVSREMWEEAYNPNQIAISLSGEPTIYPRLGEFIEFAHKRGMTTFLVSNGTLPEAIENLDPLPTQLYITVAAPNEDIYRRLLVPMIPDGWERLNETLELLPSLDTRTVIRHTLVKGWNMEGYEREYAKLIEKAEPDFIEAKGYVFVGYSRERMTVANMPSHEEIKEFGSKLGELLGKEIAAEYEPSRVVLVADRGKRTKIGDE